MSDGSNPKDAAYTKSGSDTESDTDLGAKEPDDAALAAMSQQELLELGSKIDGVQIVHKPPRWPVEGTKAEKRAERSVARWLLLGGGGFGLALLLIFLFWPWEYKPAGTEGDFLYSLATPLYGFTFG
ncbi:MAG: ubiquinol-cytochrome c reductase iron-sulfur subunit, partial [Mycobacterium sp.]|nr:ubiquinol-cytochrome c reductase iron-sulfur subunit [Mycobacterium sp.]